eukprot:CAMPEP_0202355044 /NCGR_PEP_ID=MMETSP1126-20121109/10098_1 /ASSEMBLY_ACC=CAM_ASM_000457 /TAXON_ID=3047 /ORGANISM="Dunaliella tertiolecta, Strain CCMP1320" /LENGTH=226 /DNA_ID=CAMNT_0048947585 /DNA_START=216 /DNA_END=896 /DNA_ORIENTATION=-
MANILARKAACVSSHSAAHTGLCKPAVQVPRHVGPRRGARLVAFGWDNPDSAQGEKALFGEDFGARDPFAGEIESNFGEKVLGNFDTEHVIKVPNKIKNYVGLTSRTCSAEGAQTPVQDEKEINLLKNQLAGWKVVMGKTGHPTLRFDWRLKNPECTSQLQGMITELSQAQGHAVAAMDPSGEMLGLELSTPAVSGLSENDFILAAKVNELDYKELVAPPRKRFWA